MLRSFRGARAVRDLGLRSAQAMGSVFGVIDVEAPSFEVLRNMDGYEIRRYGPSTAIETTAAGAEENNAFGRLARFIGVFGQPENAGDEKIAMTAPVVTKDGGDKGMRMQFILPANKHGQAPAPTSSQVQLVERQGGVFAVEGFSGSWNSVGAAQRAAALVERLGKDGFVVDKAVPWEFFRYNPPWTLPPFRRNEVAVPVKGL